MVLEYSEETKIANRAKIVAWGVYYFIKTKEILMDIKEVHKILSIPMKKFYKLYSKFIKCLKLKDENWDQKTEMNSLINSEAHSSNSLFDVSITKGSKKFPTTQVKSEIVPWISFGGSSAIKKRFDNLPVYAKMYSSLAIKFVQNLVQEFIKNIEKKNLFERRMNFNTKDYKIFTVLDKNKEIFQIVKSDSKLQSYISDMQMTVKTLEDKFEQLWIEIIAKIKEKDTFWIKNSKSNWKLLALSIVQYVLKENKIKLTNQQMLDISDNDHLYSSKSLWNYSISKLIV